MTAETALSADSASTCALLDGPSFLTISCDDVEVIASKILSLLRLCRNRASRLQASRSAPLPGHTHIPERVNIGTIPINLLQDVQHSWMKALQDTLMKSTPPYLDRSYERLHLIRGFSDLRSINRSPDEKSRDDRVCPLLTEVVSRHGN